MSRMRRFTLPQIAACGLALLIVNSAYLAAFAHASIFYEANVLLHLGVGLALAAVAVRWARRYPQPCGAFLLSAVPALYIAIRGNTFQHRWILWLHIVLALTALALIGLRLFKPRHAGETAYAIAYTISI